MCLVEGVQSSLGRRKEEQKVIKDLLLSNQIDKGLSVIDQLIRNSYDLKEKDNLVKLYTYVSRNRQGISNQFKLKDKEIERAGAIEAITLLDLTKFLHIHAGLGSGVNCCSEISRGSRIAY